MGPAHRSRFRSRVLLRQLERFVADSLLEGSGFELPVPLKNGVWKHDRTVRSGRI